MSGLTERFWRPLPGVRTQERSRFLFFTGLATLISLAQTLGLTGSEALFMAEHGALALPATIIGASLATVVGSFAYAARVGEARNDSLYIQMLLGAALVLGAATAGLSLWLFEVSIFLFCFYFVTQAILVTHLWTFTTDYFDTVASKRLLPLFTIGGSLGGVLGGGLAVGASAVLGPESLIAAWALFLVGAAVMLRVGRRKLRSWGPIDLEEAGESSVEGMRGAVRYVRASTLGRTLLVSSIGMMLALVVAKYMWLDAFAKSYPEPKELATFIGFFLTATNLIEIAIAMRLTPWLIRRVGVSSANLVHPALTLLSFGGLAFQYNIVSGAVARMNGEMMENALANPVRNLLYNAVPVRFKGRVRAFLEGIVLYAAMSIGGVVLWALGRPDPFWLAVAGAGASATYLTANLFVRREYLKTLVSELRAGRLDLTDLHEEIGDWEASRLADLWEQLLADESDRPSQSLLGLIPILSARGIVEPLRRAARHPSPEVRRSCITTLAALGDDEIAETVAHGLADPEARVRLASMRGLLRLGTGAISSEQLQRLVEDPDPLIRAEAALRAGAEGLAILEKMIASSDPVEAVAALSTAPQALLDAANARVEDSDPSTRAAALECVARVASEPPLEVADARRALEDADSGVRRAAVLLLANLGSDDALEALADAIADPSAEVQFAAESVLGDLGDAGVDAVERHLVGEAERAVECALRVVARVDTERSREIFHRELQSRVSELWFWVIALQRVPDGAGIGPAFLRAAYADGVARNRRLAFRILELLESPGMVQNVEKALRYGSPRARGDALEVLSHLGDRESAQLLVALHESGPLVDRRGVVDKLVSVPTSPSALIETARESRVKWIRSGARAFDSDEGESSPEEKVMERLLALKQISLFHHLSLEQLEAVQQIAIEEEFLPNEVIMREGDRGDRLYLILEGRVRVLKNYRSANENLLNEISAVAYVGEMAILDGEPRSATIVTAERSRMLTLDGNSLRELLMQMPEISFEIFRVLATRVRVAESRFGNH